MVHSVAARESRVWAAQAAHVSCIDWPSKSVLKEAPLALTQIGLSPCGQYVVGLGAGADKTVVVLDASTLEVKVAHAFPKRPSAWAVGGSRLLVADKFGDVFNVGLLDEDSVLDGNNKLKIAPILGHVSMVLAIAATEDRVLTADRDEHIRVSELPRAFVIERFLLGHTEYVAHLAIAGSLLLSGGGDRFVAAWDWRAGTSLARLDVAAALGLADDAQIDVCAIAVTANTAWIAVEGVPKVVKARFPELDVVEVIDVAAPVLSLATNGDACFAALPDAVLELGSESLAVGEPTDTSLYTQTHLRKTASH